MSITYLDLSNYKNKLQLDREDHLAESVISITDKQKLSLYKKSQKSGYSTDILEEVYRRGHMIWKADLFEGTREQFAFDRVNSFISGGFAVNLDSDLLEKEVWDRPNPKQAAGKSEKLSSAGKAKAKARARAAGRPYPNMVDNIWAARNEEYTGSEKVSKDKNESSSRFIGTKSLTDVYKKDTPNEIKGESVNTIKRIVSEATYKGKPVPLNKPMKGDVKKSKVYVDPDGDGKAQKVNFGDKNMSIKKNQPGRKKSYCARSGGQGNLTDKTSANYWSRRAWDC
jgi:hypothetical protein